MKRVPMLAAAALLAACAHGPTPRPAELEARAGLERREAGIYLRGEPVDALNVGDKLRALLGRIKSDYRLERLDAQLLEPSRANALAFPEIQLDAAARADLGTPKTLDELAERIAEAVYKLTYPSLKRGVSVSLYRKPAQGNATFACEWLVRPGGERRVTRNLDETPLNDKKRIK